MMDVYNYLGTIELGMQMLKRELIDMDTFYSQIGYRIENIFEAPENSALREVRKHINDDANYYKNLQWCWGKILKWKAKKK